MKIKRISDPEPASPLQYGDMVQIKSKNSKYSGIPGKIVGISSLNATIRFKGIKKTMSIMLDALERI